MFALDEGFGWHFSAVALTLSIKWNRRKSQRLTCARCQHGNYIWSGTSFGLLATRLHFDICCIQSRTTDIIFESTDVPLRFRAIFSAPQLKTMKITKNYTKLQFPPNAFTFMWHPVYPMALHCSFAYELIRCCHWGAIAELFVTQIPN